MEVEGFVYDEMEVCSWWGSGSIRITCGIAKSHHRTTMRGIIRAARRRNKGLARSITSTNKEGRRQRNPRSNCTQPRLTWQAAGCFHTEARPVPPSFFEERASMGRREAGTPAARDEPAASTALVVGLRLVIKSCMRAASGVMRWVGS